MIGKYKDFIAGGVAILWGVTALYVEPLASLCHPGIAFTFGVGALGRGYKELE